MPARIPTVLRRNRKAVYNIPVNTGKLTHFHQVIRQRERRTLSDAGEANPPGFRAEVLTDTTLSCDQGAFHKDQKTKAGSKRTTRAYRVHKTPWFHSKGSDIRPCAVTKELSFNHERRAARERAEESALEHIEIS